MTIDVESLLAEWHAVKNDEDLRKTNAFLWQHPQDMIVAIELLNIACKEYMKDYDEVKNTLEKREVALKYYDSIIDEQEETIGELQEIIDLLDNRVLELLMDKRALQQLISPEVINTGVDEEYSGA